MSRRWYTYAFGGLVHLTLFRIPTTAQIVCGIPPTRPAVCVDSAPTCLQCIWLSVALDDVLNKTDEAIRYVLGTNRRGA